MLDGDGSLEVKTLH